MFIFQMTFIIFWNHTLYMVNNGHTFKKENGKAENLDFVNVRTGHILLSLCLKIGGALSYVPYMECLND